MKKTILLFFMMAVCAIGHAQNSIFKKYEDTKGVSTVVVSKAMFRMMPNVDVGNRNIKKIASKIDNLQVLSCERSALISKISKDALAIYKKKPWEEAMRYKEGDQNTIIYMRSLGKEKYEYVLYNTEQGELQIISIVGDITLQDIQAITN
jgi:hypothetical protein